MSGDLRNEIKIAALNVIARNWCEGGERVATIERGLAYAEQIADAILDGGIEVRPGVRIMAVEAADYIEQWFCTHRCMTEGGPHDPHCHRSSPTLYREATDATSAPRPRNYTPVTLTGPETDLHTTNPQTALRNDPGALREDSSDG